MPLRPTIRPRSCPGWIARCSTSNRTPWLLCCTRSSIGRWIRCASHWPVISPRSSPARGSPLCFYTDGLIERPGELIDEGLARLCQAIPAEPPEVACAAVMAAMVGSQPARDDIALLIAQRQPAAQEAL